MDLKIQEYITAIEKYGNITEAASHLFITPSALNQQLLKLENDLGLPLFIRNRRKMIPTQAGSIYLDAAKQMLKIKQSAYAHIEDIAGCLSGTYEVGLTIDHGGGVFARIYPQFHAKYPKVQIKCYQLLVPEMLEMLLNNQLDLAFVLAGNISRYEKLNYIPLSSENLLLGLPKSHRLAKNYVNSSDTYEAINLQQLEGESFALNLQESTMRADLLDPLFKKYNFVPNIMMESSLNGFLQELAAMGICNAIIPQYCVSNKKDIAWFYLPDNPRFKFGVAYPKGYRLNQALKFFIELAKEDATEHLFFPEPYSRR
mgnify:FL=1